MQRVKRRAYKSLRTPDQTTQTIQETVDEVSEKKKAPVRSSLAQVWLMKDQNVKRVSQAKSLVFTSVQCKEPSVSREMIILIALTSVVCALAAYVSRGNIFKPPPPPQGHLKHLMEIFMEFVLTLAHPIIWFVNQIKWIF